MTALTGITDEMVAGQRFDNAAISAFVDETVVISIAHKQWLRPKVRRTLLALFEHKAWGCSMSEID
ncbi:hypothetical protein [Bradyrhizobium viridifuturi]|uniref:hypothetical protein n=1 Tax=Bradyrhizobium viridifuturi TaxID=1654716 RepID=UPI000AC3CD8F